MLVAFYGVGIIPLNYTEKMKTGMKTLILARFYGPTNYKGARIKCTSFHGVTWHHYNHGERFPFLAAAIAHAKKHALDVPAQILNVQTPGDTSAFVA